MFDAPVAIIHALRGKTIDKAVFVEDADKDMVLLHLTDGTWFGISGTGSSECENTLDYGQITVVGELPQ